MNPLMPYNVSPQAFYVWITTLAAALKQAEKQMGASPSLSQREDILRRQAAEYREAVEDGDSLEAIEAIKVAWLWGAQSLLILQAHNVDLSRWVKLAEQEENPSVTVKEAAGTFTYLSIDTQSTEADGYLMLMTLHGLMSSHAKFVAVSDSYLGAAVSITYLSSVTRLITDYLSASPLTHIVTDTQEVIRRPIPF